MAKEHPWLKKHKEKHHRECIDSTHTKKTADERLFDVPLINEGSMEIPKTPEWKKNLIKQKYTHNEYDSPYSIKSIKNFSLYLITKDGRLDLVSNCDTKDEVNCELKIRNQSIKAEITNSHKGTYIILETYRIV